MPPAQHGAVARGETAPDKFGGRQKTLGQRRATRPRLTKIRIERNGGQQAVGHGEGDSRNVPGPPRRTRRFMQTAASAEKWRRFGKSGGMAKRRDQARAASTALHA